VWLAGWLAAWPAAGRDVRVVREAACPAPLTAICHSLAVQTACRGLGGRGGRVIVFRSDSTLRKLRAVRTVVVDVMLKPEIHDPQGEAILGACHRLGFGEVRSVRQGKRFELEVGDAPGTVGQDSRIAELAAELLANPVIEEFAIRSY
jgi:phosphoribosylformylglycinamidine synthase subunit PurS